MKRMQAFVFGGSGALGGAVSLALARDGFDVALSYHSNEAAARDMAGAVEKHGARASIHRVDLADGRTIDDIAGEYPSLDAVVYAAAPAMPMQFVGDIEPALFARHLEADAVGFFNVAQKLLPALREAKGALVGVVTMAITRTIPRDLLSAAPKAVVEQIIRAVSLEYGKFGVRANCVAPGLIDGGLIHDLLENGDYTPEIIEAARRSTPLRSVGTPEDIAEAVAFLASPKARWITGQTLFIDGGYSR